LAGFALFAELEKITQPNSQWMTVGEAEALGHVCPPPPNFNCSAEQIYHYESLRCAAIVIDGLIKDIFDGLETHPAYEAQIAEKLFRAAERRKKQPHKQPHDRHKNRHKAKISRK
jgi:hypothetical protein